MILADLSASIMGKLNDILNKINSQNTKLNNINTNLTNNSLESTSQTILNKLDNLKVDVDLTPLNSTIGTTAEVPLNIFILQAIHGKMVEYVQPGNYTVTVPAYCSKIKITGCGGGGGGTVGYYGNSGSYGGGSGGGGAAAVYETEYTVTPGQLLNITVGSGGAGGTNESRTGDATGGNGGATKVGTILTLKGGTGAKRFTTNSGDVNNYIGKNYEYIKD